VEQLNRLVYVSRQISRLDSVEKLVSALEHLVRDYLGYERAKVHLFEDGCGPASPGQAASESAGAGATRRSPLGYVAQQGKSLQISRGEGLVREWVACLPKDIQVALMVPVQVGQGVAGVLEIGSRDQFAFDEDEAALLEALADQLAIALENAWLYAEIERLAVTDGMTGAYNVRQFYRLLEQEIVRSRRYEQEVSVLICDLDDFKHYNDRYGHLAGDGLLRQVVALLKRVSRESDVVARYGGDEFVVILPQTGPRDAQQVAERLADTIRRHCFTVGGQPLSEGLAACIGVASYPDDGEDASSLVQTADERLYLAKEEKADGYQHPLT
jgi:diguanylate cyclase (GGDEF)-like protein